MSSNNSYVSRTYDTPLCASDSDLSDDSVSRASLVSVAGSIVGVPQLGTSNLSPCSTVDLTAATPNSEVAIAGDESPSLPSPPSSAPSNADVHEGVVELRLTVSQNVSGRRSDSSMLCHFNILPSCNCGCRAWIYNA